MSKKLELVNNWPEMAQQANWSVVALAGQCGVSVDTLRRYFRKHVGTTPATWLAKQRQQRAVKLLRDGWSIKETASKIGYNQQTNFTRKFKNCWGVCPSLHSSVCGGAVKAQKII